MAADVFKRTTVNFGGAMSAEQGLMTLTGGFSPILIQNIGLSHAQQVTRIYELGVAGATPNVYYVGGRTQGQATVARVVGPAVQLAGFYSTYGDVCAAPTNGISISLNNNCSTNTQQTVPAFTMNFCVLTQVGIAVGAQDLIISENNQIMFTGMSYSGQ